MNYPEWKSSAMNPDIFIKEYQEYTMNQDLKEILNGKNVAIVGPSSHLKDKGYGDYIDSFDVVVKVGFLEDTTSKNGNDYGFRNDVLIHSFNSKEIPIAKLNIDYIASSKFVICGMVSSDFIKEHDDFLYFLNNKGVKTQNVSDEFLYGFFRRVGTICNVGLNGIEIILKYPIKSLYVTGINFYNMGKYGRIYDDEYFNMVSTRMGIYHKNIDGIVDPEYARSDLHVQEPQINYFRKLVNLDKRIILDNYLETNLFLP